jgi:3-hydroxyisobutyrate/3-hydroxypropionate dehydrogenase
MVQATTTYGFIGLGQMGHGMAKNIRQKIPENCNLVIYDVRTEAMTEFIKDCSNGSNVIAAISPKQVGELAVSLLPF